MSETLILRSPLTRHWYLVRSYKERETIDGKKYLQVTGKKEDVTEQMNDIIRMFGGDPLSEVEQTQVKVQKGEISPAR